MRFCFAKSGDPLLSSAKSQILRFCFAKSGYLPVNSAKSQILRFFYLNKGQNHRFCDFASQNLQFCFRCLAWSRSVLRILAQPRAQASCALHLQQKLSSNTPIGVSRTSLASTSKYASVLLCARGRFARCLAFCFAKRCERSVRGRRWPGLERPGRAEIALLATARWAARFRHKTAHRQKSLRRWVGHKGLRRSDLLLCEPTARTFTQAKIAQMHKQSFLPRQTVHKQQAALCTVCSR